MDSETAEQLLARSEADYGAVVRPYLTSQDIAEDPRQAPRRWVIDFGTRSLEEASEWPAALEILERDVKPLRMRNRDQRFREFWWRFGRPRGEMREAISPLRRYIAGTRHGVRFYFCWCTHPTMASDATNVFAFEDGYSLGILCSGIHATWAKALSSTLEDRPRYTPTSAFETFPWPRGDGESRSGIEEVCGVLVRRRAELCDERELGLTKLYNEVEKGMHRDLRSLHEELDKAVAAAYGWPASAAEDAEESNRRLLELNKAIVAGEVDYGGPKPAA